MARLKTILDPEVQIKLAQQQIEDAKNYQVYLDNKKVSAEKKEKDDCAVIAVSIVCGVSYDTAHETLKLHGREDGKETSTSQIKSALETLGFTTESVNMREKIDSYPTAHRVLKTVSTHHPERFNHVWKDGNTYLFLVKEHVAAIVDGVNCDWSKANQKRCHTILKVVKKEFVGPAKHENVELKIVKPSRKPRTKKVEQPATEQEAIAA